MSNDTTNPTTPTVSVPGITRIIGRNVTDLAAMLRSIEPDEMSRPELLELLGIIAASCELSGALLDDLADRANREAVARANLDSFVADIDPKLFGDGPSTRSHSAACLCVRCRS